MRYFGDAGLAVLLWFGLGIVAQAADRGNMHIYRPLDPLENARKVLLEEDLEQSVAEQRVEAKLKLAYGGSQDNMAKPRASRVRDRVTFVIAENTSTAINAKTELDSENSTTWNLSNWFTLDRNDEGNLRLKPYSMTTNDGSVNTNQQGDQYAQIKMDTKSEHDAEGKTSRSNTFKTKLSGQVIEVLPNTHLVVEAKKTIQINGETQTVTLVGVVDPNDLNEDSEVEGERIIDMHVAFSGKGEVSDTIRSGWMARLVNKFKPF